MNEMKVHFTIFNSNSLGKVPVSPYNDKTFDFETFEADFFDFPKIFKTNYVLSRNYNVKGRFKRSKLALRPYLSKKLEYIVLDLDRIHSREALDSIFAYFKKEDFYCGFIPSRGYNNKTKFNIKGIIKVEGFNTRESVMNFLFKIEVNLSEFCKVDFRSASEAGYQAPTFNDTLLFKNEGKNIPSLKLVAQKRKKVSVSDNDIMSDVFAYLYSLGFTVAEEKSDLYVFEHPNEKTPRGYFLFKDFPLILHHFNSEKSINLLKHLKKKQSVRDYFDTLNAQEQRNKLRTPKANYTVTERYLSVSTPFKTAYSEADDRPLVIKSPMGTGKSNLIEYIIEDKHSKGKKVLFITNRISVAKDIHKKYKSIKFYKNFDYAPGDSLVVQLESLHYYNLKDFDCIIIDEYVSLLLHSRNTLVDISTVNKVKLFYALKFKELIVLDAFISNVFLDFLNNPVIFENLYRDDIDIFNFNSEEDFLSIYSSSLDNLDVDDNEIISVSVNTKLMAKAFRQIAEDKGLKVLLLDSDTDEQTKEDVYKHFEKYETELWDVIIYTPTLTVGVSILNKSTKHFHFDESNTCDVISSLQMIKRNRNTKELYMFVKDSKKYNHIYYKDIIDEYFKNVNVSSDGFLVSTDEYGNIKISDFGEFLFKIEAIYNLLENSHKNAFMALLKEQFKNKIQNITTNEKPSLSKLKKDIRDEEKQKQEKLLKSISSVELNNLDEFKQVSALNDKAKVKRALAFVLDDFKRMSADDKKRLLEHIVKDKKFIEKCKLLKLFSKKETEFNSHINSLLNSKNNFLPLEKVKQLKQLLMLKSIFELKPKVTKKDIKKMSVIVSEETITRVLRMLGYKKKYNAFWLDENVDYFSKKLKEN